MRTEEQAIPGLPLIRPPVEAPAPGSAEEHDIAADERRAAEAAWALAYAGTTLEQPADLLSAVRLAALERGWRLQLEVGLRVVGRVGVTGKTGLSGPVGVDVTAALVLAFLRAAALERELGMPLFPRRGEQLRRTPPGPVERELPKTVWRAEEAQTVLDTMAGRYGFTAEHGQITDEGGTVRYRRQGYAMDLNANFVQERRHFVFSGIVARFLEGRGPLEHELPVLEYNEYAERHENRFYRDHAVLFASDLDKALRFLSVLTADGWSYGEIAHYDPGKGYGFITNAQPDSIFFRKEHVRARGWEPQLGDRVRFRCQDVRQEQKKRSSAFRAYNVSPVDERVEMDAFLR